MIGDGGDDQKRWGKRLETTARQFKSRNNEENDGDNENELETMRWDEETMGEKPRGNLIQEVSETGLYTSTGVRNMLRTKRRKVRTGNNKTRSSVIGWRMQHYLGFKAAVTHRKNDTLVRNMNGRCRNSNGNSTKHWNIVRNIEQHWKSVGRSEISRKCLWGDAGVYPARCQLQCQENQGRSMLPLHQEEEALPVVSHEEFDLMTRILDDQPILGNVVSGQRCIQSTGSLTGGKGLWKLVNTL